MKVSALRAVLHFLAPVWICLTVLCQPAFGANPVQLENALPGTTSWILNNPAQAHEIEGYASLTSVDLGGQISFYVNTVDPSYRIDIYRMGWYAGLGARQLLGGLQFPGIHQPIPSPDPTTGLIECNWTSQYTLTIPDSWVSGVYLAKLTGSGGKQSYMIFVVRDDNRVSDFLFTSSVNTYQAYNNWGGKSLYGYNSGTPAVKVSFNRPYAIGSQQPLSASGVGAGDFLTTGAPAAETVPAGWEYNAVRWLEQQGYDVTYTTDVDIHERGNLLTHHKGILIVGHSEYWSWQMRSNIMAARDGGINLAAWSANTLFWQVRLEASAITGAADRTMVCYKSTADPVSGQLTTIQWRQLGFPEEAVIGVHFVWDPANIDMIVTNTSHWVFAGTGLQDGARLSGLLGYEIDAISELSPPTALALSAANNSNMAIYTASSGAFVFATGSMQWNWGLDDYNTAAVPNSPVVRVSVLNPAAQQVSRNLLARFVQPPTVSPQESTIGPSASLQLKVLGTGSGNVTWSMSPLVGTLSPTGLYTAPGTITTTQKVTITVRNLYDPSLSASTAVTLSPTPPVSLLRLDSGSPVASTDPLGQVWAADNSVTGGSTYGVSSAISNTTTPALYQSQRYGSFSYQLTVPPGLYAVNLKFAELYYRTIGRRQFNVTINTNQVLRNFDIVGNAGAAFTAIDEAFQVQVTAGQIVIQFQNGAADAPAINAIEIWRMGPSGITLQVSPSSVTLSPSQSQTLSATVTGTSNTTVTWTASPSGVGLLTPTGNSTTYTAPASIPGQRTVTVTATSVADGSIAASATVTLSPTTPSPDGTLVPGASQIVDSQGAVWTIGAGQAILRNGTLAAGGYGTKILWSGGTIYVLGLSNTWWKWLGSGWTNVGATQPGVSITPPPPPPTTPSPDGTLVPGASQIVDSQGAVWTIGAGQAILRNGMMAADGYGTKILWSGGTIYVLGLSNTWWKWLGPGWTNVGATQPGVSITPPPTPPPTTPSPDGTLVPGASQIVDSQGAVWTIGASQAILRNGAPAAGGSGTKILWSGGTIYVLGVDNNWWKWLGSGWTNVGPTQPTTSSPNGTLVPTASQIVDNQNAVWTIGANQAILRNGTLAAAGYGTKILWTSSTIYVFGLNGTWWKWLGSGWANVGSTQPS